MRQNRETAMKTTLALIAALFIGQAALAHEYTLGDLTILHPNIATPRPGAPTAAGYLAIHNGGTTPDRLTAITADFAGMAMLHATETDANGVTRMSHLPGLDIPPGETVLLEPGSMHIMFMGLTGDVAEGDMLPVTLTFEKAGSIAVEFKADPAIGAPGHDHAAPSE
jgi:periplasmic copper chaperone A